MDRYSYANAAAFERLRRRGDGMTDALTMMRPSTPTLAVIADAYGAERQEAYLFATLFAHQEQMGAREKMDGAVLHGLAQGIAVAWGDRLKVPEWLCFLARDRGGIYGPVYGGYTPASVTDHLVAYYQTDGRRWREWCIAQLAEHPEKAQIWND